MNRLFTRFQALLVGSLICSLVAVADEVPSKFLPSGLTRKVGGYRPIRAELVESSDIVTTLPNDLVAPRFGLIELGDRSWAFVLDEPEDQEARLFVDTNGDGDLTNDPQMKWEQRPNGTYFGTCQVDLGGGVLGNVELYRFDPNGPARAAMKNILLYYSDFGYEYELNLDGESFETFIAGAPSPGMSLSVDRDRNGKISAKLERVTIGEPFNFTGTTYVLSAEDGRLLLSQADQELPITPMPPDLSIGKPAIPFVSTTLDGNKLDFPKHYAGKLVMLDFWATWCGPCIGEIPHMKEAYNTWHSHDFEILGISFDQENMEEKLNEFLAERELPWPQIYEGAGWNTELGTLYDVSGIPFTLLVDGDTGEILGDSRNLRGEGLTAFVGEQLQRKFGDRIQLSKDEVAEVDEDF